MKKEKIVYVFEEDMQYGLPTKPNELLKFLKEKINLIPKEYMDSAEIEFNATSFYDSACLDLTISYKRLESDSEEITRLGKEKKQRERRENQELCQLEKLKEKYEI